MIAILLALGAVPADKVTSLPGFGVPPTTHYSGYLPVGKFSGSPGMLHYWLQTSGTYVHALFLKKGGLP